MITKRELSNLIWHIETNRSVLGDDTVLNDLLVSFINIQNNDNTILMISSYIAKNIYSIDNKIILDTVLERLYDYSLGKS